MNKSTLMSLALIACSFACVSPAIAGPEKGNASGSQTQHQNQGQSQSQTANGGNASIGNGAVVENVSAAPTATAANDADLSNVGNANAAANGSGNGTNDTHISEYSAAPRIPVSTAYAPSLTAGADTCLGSITGGAQTSFFGVSVGGTKRDQNCEHIKNTHLIMEFNREAGCDYMLKNVPGAAEAFKDVGANCKGTVVVTVTVTSETPPVGPVISNPTIVTPLPVPPIVLKSPSE